MELHWEVISPNYNDTWVLIQFSFHSLSSLTKEERETLDFPQLHLIQVFSGSHLPASSFSSPWFFLSWVPTSPSSTFFLLVIINVQVVLIPFYVSRHWLFPHHSALGYFFLSEQLLSLADFSQSFTYNYLKFNLYQYTSAGLIQWHSEGTLFPLMCFAQCMLLIMGTYAHLE